MRPKAFYHAIGRKKFFEFILFAVFILFFYGPLMHLFMLAFSNRYEVPSVIPQEWGFRWWEFIFKQKSLVSSISLSFVFAITTTLVSMCFCLPAAYAFARIQFPARRVFLLSFLLTNAFPRMGLYASIALLYYKYRLMGTFIGVLIIHILQTMMFMTWIPANAFRSVHRQQEESARDVGAGPFKTFLHVTFPMAVPGIMVASLFTFLGSLDEAQGTLLVGFPQFKTMPVEMYGIIMQYANTVGPVFSLLLIAPVILILLIVSRFVSAETIAKGFKMK